MAGHFLRVGDAGAVILRVETAVAVPLAVGRGAPSGAFRPCDGYERIGGDGVLGRGVVAGHFLRIGDAGTVVLSVESAVTGPAAGFDGGLPAVVAISLVNSGVGGGGVLWRGAGAWDILFVPRTAVAYAVIVGVAVPLAVWGRVPCVGILVPRHGHIDEIRRGMGRMVVGAQNFLRVGNAGVLDSMETIHAVPFAVGRGAPSGAFRPRDSDVGEDGIGVGGVTVGAPHAPRVGNAVVVFHMPVSFAAIPGAGDVGGRPSAAVPGLVDGGVGDDGVGGEAVASGAVHGPVVRGAGAAVQVEVVVAAPAA